MSWNYRVVRQSKGDERWLSICEVYYQDDKVTPRAYGDGGAPFSNEGNDEMDIRSLGWTLDKMREALSKPILDEKDFGLG